MTDEELEVLMPNTAVIGALLEINVLIVKHRLYKKDWEKINEIVMSAYIRTEIQMKENKND